VSGPFALPPGVHQHTFQPGPVVAAISEATIGSTVAGWGTQRDSTAWKATRIAAMCGCGFTVFMDVAPAPDPADG